MHILDPQEINVFSGSNGCCLEEKISRHENEYFCQMYTTIYKASTSQGPTRPFRLWPQHSTFSTFLKVVQVKYWPLFSSSRSLNWQCAKRPMANLPEATAILHFYNQFQ